MLILIEHRGKNDGNSIRLQVYRNIRRHKSQCWWIIGWIANTNSLEAGKSGKIEVRIENNISFSSLKKTERIRLRKWKWKPCAMRAHFSVALNNFDNKAKTAKRNKGILCVWHWCQRTISRFLFLHKYPFLCCRAFYFSVFEVSFHFMAEIVCASRIVFFSSLSYFRVSAWWKNTQKIHSSDTTETCSVNDHAEKQSGVHAHRWVRPACLATVLQIQAHRLGPTKSTTTQSIPAHKTGMPIIRNVFVLYILLPCICMIKGQLMFFFLTFFTNSLIAVQIYSKINFVFVEFALFLPCFTI